MKTLESSVQRARTRALISFLVFFASGMAGLVYQVVWSRMLTLVIGVSIYAITAVVCSFMAGLALGSYLIGRWGDRWRDPLRVYGVLEGIIGVYALLTPLLFQAMTPAYVAAFRSFEGPGLNLVRIALSTLVLMVPTTLMGGTLPLLARLVTRDQERTASGVGLLYGVNTLGAVVGCFLAGFVLLAKFGIHGSLRIAALTNLAIAVLTFLAPRTTANAGATIEKPTVMQTADRAGRFVLGLFFVSGIAALGYELLWTRALLVYVHSSTYAFSVMLGVYLLGIGAGSTIAAGLAGRNAQPLFGLAVCQLGVIAASVTGLLLFPQLASIGFGLVGSDRIDSFARGVGLMLAQASVILLVPTLFMGAMFPFGVAAYHRTTRGVSQSVGSLYAVNTAGNIVGSLLVGFCTIPLLGVRHSMILMIALNIAVVATIMVKRSSGSAARIAWIAGAVGVVGATHLAVSDQVFYRSLVRLPGTRIVYYREGASDTVGVVERDKPVKSRTLIYSDGRGAAGTGSLVWNLYFGHLPMLLHPDPKRVLHICFGSGNSVMALTRHDVEQIDVVELSPHVREAAQYFWTNEGVLANPKVNLVIEDGRNYLLGTDRSYDVISLEPPNIYSAGVVNLYTQEFYELARGHLNPGGIMMQWLPSATLAERDRGHLIRAFTEAFPYVAIFQQLLSPQLLLVGTLQPLAVDTAEVNRRLQAPAMKNDIAIMRTPTADEYLAWFRLGDAATRKLVEAYEPVRDDRTIVDYTIPYYVGSGFGFYYHTYPVGPEGFDQFTPGRERTFEYLGWSDPISLIVPDPTQAARIEDARLRMINPLREQPAS